jgi:hypothetical protein
MKSRAFANRIILASLVHIRVFTNSSSRPFNFTSVSYSRMIRRQLLQSGVAVEKLHFSQNSENLGDRKCLGKPRKSFLGHPNAILF